MAQYGEQYGRQTEEYGGKPLRRDDEYGRTEQYGTTGGGTYGTTDQYGSTGGAYNKTDQYGTMGGTMGGAYGTTTMDQHAATGKHGTMEHGKVDTGIAAGREEGGRHRRSGSSSSSSGEEVDDGQGGRKKKGLVGKIKDILPGGGHKTDEGHEHGAARGEKI